MVYSFFLNGGLSWENIFPEILFYFLGAILAGLLTFSGHLIACLITRTKPDDYNICFNKKGFLSLYTFLGLLLIPLIGMGFTTSPKFNKESKGKSVFIALAGPVFTFLISYCSLFIYYFNTVPVIGSIIMGFASSGILLSLTNILPLPGLCGGVLISALLPEKLSEKWNGLKDIRIIIMIILIVLIVRSQINVYVNQEIIKSVNLFFGE